MKSSNVLFVAFALAIGCTMSVSAVQDKSWKHNHHQRKVKNIIFMVPDGQGLSNVVAARVFKNGPSGAPLYQETLENIGYQHTYSADSLVTDSAAAASAWAMGEKYNNGEISCHGDEDQTCKNESLTILELAKARGMATGLVVTSQISHATPAAFGAHTYSRNCGLEIARQYIAETGVDVIMGGGIYKADNPCDVYEDNFKGVEDRRQYIIDLATENGYTFIAEKAAMQAATSTTTKKGQVNKVLAMFEQNGTGEGKTPELFWVDGSAYPATEPTLAEMTTTALDILKHDRDGMFLMIEGSQIDWEDHAHNATGQIAESLAFDQAVKVVLDWINSDPKRKEQTLLIVVADHETGGFAVNGPYGGLPEAGTIVEPGWTSDNHTAVDTIIYSQGPGSDALNCAVDNTQLFYVMKSVLKNNHF